MSKVSNEKVIVPLWLKAIHALTLLLVLPWPLAVYFSVFLFDAPSSTSSIFTWFAAFTMWLYPIGILACIFIGRKFYKEKKVLSVVFTMIPILLTIGLGVQYNQLNQNALWGLGSFSEDSQKELVLATASGNTKKIKELITSGVSPDVFNVRGQTPLIIAFEARQLESFKALLTLDANPNLIPKGFLNNNIAAYILFDPKTDWTLEGIPYLNALIQAGLDPWLSDGKESLIHYASTTRKSEYLSLFLKLGVSPHLKSKFGTPLELAISRGAWDNVILLLTIPKIQITEGVLSSFNNITRGFDGKIIDNDPRRNEVLETLVNLFNIERTLLVSE